MAKAKAPRRRAGGLLLEFAMIILGALLALALDDWRDQQERDARDHAVLIQLEAELAANEQRLVEESRYHHDMREPIREARERMMNEGAFALPEGWQGGQPILLTRTAFDVAVMNGVLARMPPDTALSLAHVYEVAERGTVKRNNVNLAMLQSSFTDGVLYLRLQEQAILTEINNADTLLPLLREARERVEQVQTSD